MRYLSLMLALFLFHCGSMDDVTLEQNMERRTDPFGIITSAQVREWSALIPMSQNGFVNFCIQNTRSSRERQTIENYATQAVNQWTALLNRDAPGNGYPAWSRRSVAARFACSGDYYTIAMFNGRSNCEYWRQRINLGYDTPAVVMIHEFGHAIGLADTYSYQGGTIQNQPESMMQAGQRFSEDDYHGVWAMWRYVSTGQIDCGPGYRESSISGNTRIDHLCEPGGGGGETCRYRCSDYRFSEGECRDGWKCTNQCLDYIGTCPQACQYRCTDYGFREGQCYQGWRCSDGCLGYVGRC